MMTPRPVAATRWVAAVLASAMVLGAPELNAQEPDAKIRIAGLIVRLGSLSYREREAASDALALLGTAPRDALQEAARNADPEVRLRAKELLRRLQIEELWSPGRVQYQADGTLASRALFAIGEQTGNRVLVGDQYGAFHDAPIEARQVAGTFWEVIDDLCRQSGNRVRQHYDTRSPGLVVVAGAPGKHPLAYSGPIRAQITGARRVFSEELNYETLESQKTHTFQFDLQMMWEDRFRLVAYRSQPELLEAVTDTDVHLAATQPASSGWNVAGSGTRQLSMNLRLHPPATSASQLETLKLSWGLIAVGDLATLDVEQLENREPHYQDDVELVIESVQNGPGPRCELSVLVTRDLIVPEPQDVLFQENELELFDTEGRAYRKQGQTNTLSDQGARLKVTFLGESTQSQPKVLRFVYPRIRAQKNLELVFRNVPLPVGKPE